MKVRMFNIICKGEPDFKIGEKLALNDNIETSDFIELSNNDYKTIHKRFLYDMSNAYIFYRQNSAKIVNY